MPTSTFVNGTATRRPGVYASVDASDLSGNELTTNVMAIIGDFPELRSATPTRFNTPTQIKNFSDSYLVQLLAKVLYSPSNDPQVTGSPAAVYFVNGGASTQASTVLVDGDGTNALTIKSKKYGTVGNTGTVSNVVTSGGSGGDRTLAFNVNGTTETFVFDGQTLLTIKYAGTDASAMTLDVKDSSGTRLRVTQTKSAIASGAYTLATASWKWDGSLTFTASGSGNHSLAVSGVRKDTGAAFSSTLTFTGSTTPDTALGFEVSAITALTWTPAASETLTVTGYAFNLDLTSAEFKTIKNVFDHIGSYSSQGWTVSYLEPVVGSIDSIYMDKIDAGTNIYNPTAANITADLYRLYLELLDSDVVEPTLGAITTTGLKQVAAYVGVQNMSGGTFTAGTSTTIGNAYTAMRTVEAQVFVNYYTDLTSQQLLQAHCQYMASTGYGECNGWTATAASETKANIKTRTALLNTRHICLAGQEAQIYDHTGASTWQAPLVLATMLAAMQASTPVGTPLTWKLVNVLDVRSDSTWDADADANELLGMGLVFLTTSSLGFRVERSITTYQTDDNLVFSEMSSNESLYTSIRDLRDNCSIFIGSPNTNSTASLIKAKAYARLQWQVDNGIIKGFRSLQVTTVGDKFVIDVELAVVNPVNFINIQVKVTNVPTVV